MPIMPASISESITITQNGEHNIAKYTMANVNVEPVVESLNVTPSTSAQSLTPTTGVAGFNEVNVSAVTSSIDANIIPGNIKKDITILGVTGTHEGGTTPTGTKNITTNGTHDVTNYASANVNVPTSGPTYYVEKSTTGSGANKKLVGGSSFINLSDVHDLGPWVLAYAFKSNTSLTIVDMSSLTKISDEGALYHAFTNATNLTSVDLSNVATTDHSSHQIFSRCFMWCYKLETLNLHSLTYAFGRYYNEDSGLESLCCGCSALKSVDLSSLETAPQLQSAFASCTSLESISLPKLTNVVNMRQCFSGCTALKTFTWNVNATYTEGEFMHFGSMFYGCTELTSVTFPATVSSVYAAEYMFSECSKLEEIIITFDSLYNGTQFTIPLSEDEQMSNGMFLNCSSLKKVDFQGLSEIVNTLTLSGNTPVYPCEDMFAGCNLLYHIKFPDLATISGRYTCKYMFRYCTGLKNIVFDKLSDISEQPQQLFSYAFVGCENLTNVFFPALTSSSFGSNKTQFNSMLSSCVGVTVHFPSNLQSVIGSWASVTGGFSGTTCVAKFDLVSEITDSNGNTYIRDRMITSDDNINKDIILDSIKWYDTTNDVYVYTIPTNNWADSEPKVNDVIYDSAMQIISATVASVA